MDPTAIALLIDADNCPAAKITVILDELSKFGVVNIRRAYGDWKASALGVRHCLQRLRLHAAGHASEG